MKQSHKMSYPNYQSRVPQAAEDDTVYDSEDPYSHYKRGPLAVHEPNIFVSPVEK